MLLDEKPLDRINLEDIRSLIAEQVFESHRLDFKLEWWGNNDEGKREMLRDERAGRRRFRYFNCGIAPVGLRRLGVNK